MCMFYQHAQKIIICIEMILHPVLLNQLPKQKQVSGEMKGVKDSSLRYTIPQLSHQGHGLEWCLRFCFKYICIIHSEQRPYFWPVTLNNTRTPIESFLQSLFSSSPLLHLTSMVSVQWNALKMRLKVVVKKNVNHKWQQSWGNYFIQKLDKKKKKHLRGRSTYFRSVNSYSKIILYI